MSGRERAGWVRVGNYLGLIGSRVDVRWDGPPPAPVDRPLWDQELDA